MESGGSIRRLPCQKRFAAEREKEMLTAKRSFLLVLAVMLALPLAPARILAQGQVMGELQFAGATRVERNSGVWIDGQYVGYLKELKGDKKIVLLPGDHEVSIRQAGYKDFTKNIVVEPKQVQRFTVTMQKDPRAIYPAGNAATLKLD